MIGQIVHVDGAGEALGVRPVRESYPGWKIRSYSRRKGLPLLPASIYF